VKRTHYKESEKDLETEYLQAFGVFLSENDKVPFVSWVNELKYRASLYNNKRSESKF